MSRPEQRAQGIWGHVTDTLVDDLVSFCDGKRVLEVYAGRGHLARRLRERGISLVATSLFSGHDQHDHYGLETEVIEMDCVEATQHFKDRFDVLLVVWPTADEGLYRALRHLPFDTPIIFIGEITDYSRAFLGGCATDAFFAAVRKDPEQTARIRYSAGGYGADELAVFYRRQSDTPVAG